MNKSSASRAIKDALVKARRDENLTNKELFEVVLEAIPNFFLNQRPDRRRKFGREQIEVSGKLFQLAQDVKPYLS